MRYQKRPVTVEIAGLKIKTQQTMYKPGEWSPYITIPKSALLKILALGDEKVTVRCEGIYTDDYAYDAADNYGKGTLSSDWMLQRYQKDGTYGLTACFNPAGDISFSRHQNEHYNVRPVVGTITMTER